jgi:glutathione synthase
MNILLIDPIEKLTIKKDSTIYMAITAKLMKQECYLLFSDDLVFQNIGDFTLKVYDYDGQISTQTGYVESFEIGASKTIKIKGGEVLHMRLEPPFDVLYLKSLWILRRYEQRGIKVVNSASGIAVNNEKLLAYGMDSDFPTYVGGSENYFWSFVEKIQAKSLIVKPLDLFQGIGVEKWECSDGKETLLKKFLEKRDKTGGTLVVQPFMEDIYKGEIRSIYYGGRELGSILKKPKEGQWLANIAQGASFSKAELNSVQKKKCDAIATHLLKEGISWIAYDILGDKVSEVNITCPGLLVETSIAAHKNLAMIILENH